MSGHSKWASIKHKKGATDAKRGKIFTRHAKLIEIAAREGGSGDPGMNASLKTAIENAKAENVPNTNIDRAIKKGTGELKGEQTVAVTYEAYAPGGAAVIVECLTDNKNRTLPNVRASIERQGGKWAESGSVMWMFEKKGIVMAKSDGELSDDIQLELIDAGAENFEVSDGTVTVTTRAADWPKVRDAIKSARMELEEAGMKYVAKQSAKISDVESAKKLMNFVEELEADEDVSEVHTNADISDEVANQL